jgi:molecular chaperone GrpE
MAEPTKTTETATGDGPGQQPQDAAALLQRLQAAEQERDEYKAAALRTRADFENYQKRFQRDLATERLYAQMPLAHDLLPALDNLERAVTAANQAG